MGCCEKGLSLVVELLADSHTGRDFVLDVDDARAQYLAEQSRHSNSSSPPGVVVARFDPQFGQGVSAAAAAGSGAMDFSPLSLP